MSPRTLTVLTALALVLAAALPARAESSPAPSDEAGVEEARQRFLRGVELYREGSMDAALAEFNKAYEIAPNFRVLYNLAQVQTERHDYVAALRLMQQYLRDGGQDVPSERREQVEREALALQSRIGELTVTAGEPGAELFVDGVSAGVLPLPTPVLVSSGVRRIELKKVGYRAAERTLTVAGGEKVALELGLEPEAASAPSTGPERGEEKRSAAERSPAVAADSKVTTRSAAPLWITLASTAVLAGGAVTFGVLARASDEELEQELDRLPADPERIADSRRELKRNALLSDGLTVAAAASGGLFLYFALTGSGSSSRSRTGTALQIGAGGAGAPGVTARGRF